jgi:hypothetical protein
MDRLNRSPIEPIYPQATPNEAIQLGTIAVQFSHKDKTYNETAIVTMRFLPDDRLLFVVPAKEQPERAKGQAMTPEEMKAVVCSVIHLDEKWDRKLVLPDHGVTLDALWLGSGGDRGAISFTPRTSVVTVMPKSESISRATFHLFNFPDFFGPDDYVLTEGGPPRQGWRRCGRAVLMADGWTITIAATDKTDDLCKALDAQGGYVVTHMGEIRREDGSTFPSDQLDGLMHCLHAFLSFVLGRWAGIAFPVGFDKDGKKIFEQWGLPSTAPGDWQCSASWFDSHHGELLTQTFRGFSALWKNSLWHTPLWKAIYWYLLANNSNADSGLVLAQTALELLAWTYCVEDRKMVSANAFGERGLSAADKLRILASTLDIPLGLPAHLEALNAPLPGSGKWRDAMEAITGIRNVLVHPHAKIKPHDGSYYEAGKLSLWYLDLVLLQLCGHGGKYGNRLSSPRWAGTVESVPWAKNEPEKAGT